MYRHLRGGGVRIIRNNSDLVDILRAKAWLSSTHKEKRVRQGFKEDKRSPGMTRSHLECHRWNSIWQLSNTHMHRHTHQHKCVLLEPMCYGRPPRFSKRELFKLVRMKNITTHIYIYTVYMIHHPSMCVCAYTTTKLLHMKITRSNT